MSNESSYKHVQHAPLCLLIYVLAVVLLVLGLVMNTEPPIPWLFPPIGLFMLVLAASYHHLTVEDQVDRLSVSFGPIPLFRRSIRYDEIISALSVWRGDAFVHAQITGMWRRHLSKGLP